MKVKLNNGIEMPMLGLGTWQISDRDAENAVLWALEAGYRHIDTAAYYNNEAGVGKAIRKSGIARDEIFVTTKLKNEDHRNPGKAFEASIKKLGTGYVDLYLIHWPVQGLRNNTWKVFEKLYRDGRCKAIGVSNFTIRHLEELLKVAEIVPAVNQVEFSPYLYQKDLLEFCKKNKIQLEAYSPLTRGQKLNDKKIVDIANNYNKTSAQILIRWCLQHNIVVIPKSKTKKRIEENINVFDFSIRSGDMKRLDDFDENLRLCWDPTNLP